MEQERLMQLFVNQLCEMYDAEKQIVKGLPEMIEAADSPELRQAFQGHLKETQQQVKRLEKIFKELNIKPDAIACEAMQGLIEECKEVSQEFEESALRDAALIAKAQCIEHYEISAYGTLRAFAKELGLDNAKKLIQESIDEEGNADKKLTKIAEGSLLTAGVNRRANE